MWVHPSTHSFFAKYITQRLSPPRLSLPSFPPLRRSISPPPAAAPAHTATPHALTFFYSTYVDEPYLCTILTFCQTGSISKHSICSSDRSLRSRTTRSIIFLNQSPTTAAPPTPIGDDTHHTLLTVHHDEEYTLCIHAFITGLEAGAYADGCCIPP